MELNPFANSLRYYDPTISPAPFISKKKMSEEIKEVAVPLGSVLLEANTKKRKNFSNDPPFPKKITELDFGPPPDNDYDEEPDFDVDF